VNAAQEFSSLKDKIALAKEKKAASEARVEEHRKRAKDLMAQLEAKGVPLDGIQGFVDKLDAEVKEGLSSVGTLLEKIPN